VLLWEPFLAGVALVEALRSARVRGYSPEAPSVRARAKQQPTRSDAATVTLTMHACGHQRRLHRPDIRRPSRPDMRRRRTRLMGPTLRLHRPRRLAANIRIVMVLGRLVSSEYRPSPTGVQIVKVDNLMRSAPNLNVGDERYFQSELAQEWQPEFVHEISSLIVGDVQVALPSSHPQC
jgi:hypothetical protein